MQTYSYIFKVGGNFQEVLGKFTATADSFNAQMEVASKGFDRLVNKMAGMFLLKDAFTSMTQGVEDLSRAGISLDSQMHDLSAIAGVTGDALKEIEGYARQSAKTFGTDASVAVEGYKLLLSQLSPELAKQPAALQAMGNNIQIVSKLMGGDGVAAAEVLTTAMNQYGVSLDDPIKASEEMARMMNVMAAAGQEGSAELPAIKVALEQCGMAAKSANVAFEETNAAIQVLDKAGRKGSEGGISLRNVLASLSQGRFLPERVQEELRGAGIDVMALSDKSLSLKSRLDLLKPILNDDALLSATFGKENANAARALIQGTDALGQFTEAITGTNSAQEQANIIMQSYAERQARVKQHMEDMKISLFQMTGDFSLWITTIGHALVPLSQLLPLLHTLYLGITSIAKLNFGAVLAHMSRMTFVLKTQMLYLNKELATGIFTSNGFIVNMWRATVAMARFATVGLWNAIKGMGAFVLSLVTGGATSATFSAIASASFGAFATSAVISCKAVGVAIMNIPIIGWVAAAIAALVALGVYFWNTSAKFRAVLKGIGSAFVATFKGIWDLAKTVFGSIGDLIKAAFSLDGDGISKAINRLKGGFSDFGTNVGKAFSDSYNAEMEASRKEQDKEKKKDGKIVIPEVPAVGGGNVNPIGGTLKSAPSAEKTNGIKSITVNVDRLVDKFEIHTTNLSNDLTKVKEAVAETLLSAINDTNLATG